MAVIPHPLLHPRWLGGQGNTHVLRVPWVLPLQTISAEVARYAVHANAKRDQVFTEIKTQVYKEAAERGRMIELLMTILTTS